MNVYVVAQLFPPPADKQDWLQGIYRTLAAAMAEYPGDWWEYGARPDLNIMKHWACGSNADADTIYEWEVLE